MINVRENNSGQEWTIQRHWQQWTHKTQDDDKQNKYIHNTKQKSHSNCIQSEHYPAYAIWFFFCLQRLLSYLAFSYFDECFSRNASCLQILKSTFLFNQDSVWMILSFDNLFRISGALLFTFLFCVVYVFHQNNWKPNNLKVFVSKKKIK
jgi:hypothetical protein